MLGLFDATHIGWRNEPIYRFGISANKLFDHMHAGRPVIHSVNAGNDPIREAGCAISVMSEHARAIADAILQLYHMAEERMVLGHKSRDYGHEQSYLYLVARKIPPGFYLRK